MASDPLTVLSVTVNENNTGTQYRYELRTSGGTEFGALEQEYSLAVNQKLVRDLCRDMDEALKAALSGESGYRDGLIRNGRTLYNHLFRPVKGTDEPAIMVKVRESPGPLLVRSDETLVPWELLHDGTDFLGLTHDLGQGSVVQTSFLPGREVGPLEKALIIGDPLGDLPAASREAERICTWLTARGTECTILRGSAATLANVVTELSSTQYDLLHYCGHITIGSERVGSGLLLDQRGLLDESALRTASRIGAPPVVFVNGCKAVGRIANLCLSFMTLGSKVVVGTRAEVAEDSARRFAETFYRRLLDDETAGAAMRAARHSVLDAPDGAWASFLLYGNPSVHITGRDPSPTRSGTRELYSAEAAAMLNRITDGARDKGIVTSIDLLFGLITCPELQPAMRRAVGATNLVALTTALRMLIGGDDATNERPENANGQVPDVQLSDTVEAALMKAKEIASAQGRSVVTPRDIATAHVEIGGGSSARLLEIVDVTLPQLLSPDGAHSEEHPKPPRDAPPTPPTVPTPPTSPTSPRPAAPCFDGNGRLRTSSFTAAAASAIRAALLLAVGKGSIIGSNTLLRGFGITGSIALRTALEKQGDAGRQASRALSSPTPHRDHFSERSRTAVETARTAVPAAPVDEVTLLLTLLEDEGSSARQLLAELGIDSVRLIEDLRRSDPPDTNR